MKTVGILNVLSIIKAGDEGSQAVYPRASKVFLIPPLGKEEASGSCWERAEAEKDSTTPPYWFGVINASCFSAVPPVRGWNQCV